MRLYTVNIKVRNNDKTMVISFLNGRVKDKLQHCFCFLDIYWLEDENYTKQSVFVHYREENIIFNLVSEL